MLQAISERTKTWVSWVLAILLSLAFGLWGISYYLQGGRPDQTIVTVDGVGIQKHQIDTMYRQLRNRFLSSGQVMTGALEKQLQDQSLKNLMHSALLDQALHRLGFCVSDEQIEMAIMRNPLFQVNGVFSEPRFHALLRNNMLSETDYANSLKKDFMNTQIQQGFSASAYLFPEQVSEAYALLEQTRDIDYAILKKNPNQKPANFDDTSIKAYYEAHQIDYRIPEKVSIEYVLLSLEGVRKHQTVSDKAIQSYYTENPERFKSPNGKVLPLERVSAQIEATLKNQKAEEAFAQLKNQLSNLTYANPDSLKVASDILHLPIQSSDSFTLEVPGTQAITKNKRIRMMAFSEDVLTNGNNSPLLDDTNTQTAIVFRIKTHEPESTQPLSVVREKIIAALQAAESKTALATLASQLAEKLNQGATITALSKEYHITTWHHQKQVSLHDVDLPGVVMRYAFQARSLGEGQNTVYWQAFPKGEDQVLIGVSHIHYAQPSQHEGQSFKTLQEELENTQGSAWYQAWLDTLIQQAHVSPGKLKYLLGDESSVGQQN